jgi:hypothetical protein
MFGEKARIGETFFEQVAVDRERNRDVGARARR